MTRILVISLKRLGDVILTTPALRRLARALPDAQIDFLVYPEFAPVLEGNPYLRQILIYPKNKPWRLPMMLRRGRYDWAVDFLTTGASSWASFLSGAPRRLAFENSHPRFIHNLQIPHPTRPLYSALKKNLLSDHLIDSVGARTVSEEEGWRPEIFVPKTKLDYWGDVLASIRGGHPGPVVMMSPVSRRSSRAWSLDGFAGMARRLARHQNALVLCLWGPGEKVAAEEVVRLSGESKVKPAPGFSTVADLAAFVSHASLLMTNCNGTRHVATARRVPTLTVHMSSDPVSWNAPNSDGSGFHPLHPVVRVEKLWCIGCQKNICPYRLECSSLLSADSVYHEAVQLLNRTAKIS